MCMYCKNSTTFNSTTTHVVNYKNCIIVIKNVPCLECDQCGEKYYTDEVAERLELIVNMAKAGKSIIMISSEMPELLGICDRIAVMYEGRITGVVERKEATQEKIMAYAANIVKREGESKDEQ